MILIGEKLNSSIPSTHAILEARDGQKVRDLVRRQVEAGASWLDLNAGMFIGEEAGILSWMAGIAADGTDTGLVLDSPDPDVLGQVAATLTGRTVMLNSVTLESDRFEKVAGLALRYDTSLIALPVQGKRMPADLSELTDTAERLLDALKTVGMPDARIYLDILVSAAAVDDNAPMRSLTFAGIMRERHPDIHLTAGVSNVSFGLPGRRAINAAFLTAAICAGVDAPILDVLDETMMKQLAAARLIAGQDEYCMDYLESVRGPRDAN